MIMKNQLLNLKMIALMCLMMVLGGANVWAESKTYSYVFKTGDFSASKLSAKLNEVTWTLKVNAWNGTQGYDFDQTKGFKIGSGNKNYPKDATLSTSEIEGTITSIVINTSGNSKTTAKLDVLVGGKAFGKQQALTSNAKDLSFTGSASGQIELKYSNSNKPIYVKSIAVTYETAPAKTLKSLAITGEPDKKTYEEGKPFEPAGLVVTGTYDDNTTATITDGITWAMNPATLSLNDVSCSVTATVDGVTSPAYNVTGLTVNKAKLSATINLTGNATTLATDDEPNTFTIDYKGDGTLSATASAEGVVDLALVDKTVTVTPKAAGSVDITISATEGTEYKATSTTYTVNVVPVGIRALRNSITSISSKSKTKFSNITLKDAVVTYVGVKYSNKTFYVEDANAGIVFYNKDLNYEVGDVLNGTISGEGFIFQGLTEVTSINSNSNITVTKGGKVPCTEITLAELNENMDKWESRRIKVVNSILTTALDAKNDAIISQDGSSITVYEKKDDCSGGKLANEGSKLESVVGYPVDFRQNQDSKILNELCVWEESDIVVAEPTYTPATVNFVAYAGVDYYATFSNANVVFMPKDVTVSAVTVDNNNVVMQKLGKEETVEIAGNNVAGYYIPANTGVLLNSKNSGEVTYYTVANKEVAPFDAKLNMLMPSVAGGVFTAEPGKVYYKLAYNNYDKHEGLGFYWGADNGAAFYVKAGTAYLAVPASKAGAKGFAFNGEATGIDGVNANVENAKAIYNINGQRVASMAKPGLYIVNGKKVVRK